MAHQNSILNKAKQAWNKFAQNPTPEEEAARKYPEVIRTNYQSLPVPYPESFLAPLPDPSIVEVSRIDFASKKMPEYKDLYAVVLDGVLSREECEQLLRYAEMSKGAHGNGEEGVDEPADNGWGPALVNAGRNHEVLATHYRNSDRIIWDEQEITRRLWKRVMQGEGMNEYFSRLHGEEYRQVLGSYREGEVWTPTSYGLNERMRFLRYGPGQFFKEHCDGTYETPDGKERSFYTFHLYLQDSAQVLGVKKRDGEELLRGGATTFHSQDMKRRVDVDPRMGRVLIFQHRSLLHSGDLVKKGVKYTMRSDVMFQQEGRQDLEMDDGVVFE